LDSGEQPATTLLPLSLLTETSEQKDEAPAPSVTATEPKNADDSFGDFETA
jgi:hypothetical protein